MVWKRLHFHHLEGRGVLIPGASVAILKKLFLLYYFFQKMCTTGILLSLIAQENSPMLPSVISVWGFLLGKVFGVIY